MYKVVFVRHGKSIWNEQKIFTGWEDVDLSSQGIKEAHLAGEQMKKAGFSFDIAYTSLLKRAIRTLWIILDTMDLMWIPVIPSYHLNERHYGTLQCLTKQEAIAKYGESQVSQWRINYNICPPKLENSDPRYPIHDPRYAQLTSGQIPTGESLQDAFERLLPYWKNTIIPTIRSQKRVLIVAHSNLLKGLTHYLNNGNLTEGEIIPTQPSISTGKPQVYELDKEMKAINHYDI